MEPERFAIAQDGTRLYVRSQGALQGTVALLCDGIACDGFIWKYLWDDLGARMPVVHWNYRGHGRSAPPANPMHVEFHEHVQDLDAVHHAVGAPDVVLFGHSMGCQVALEGCRTLAPKVRGAVLLCGSPGRITHTFKGGNSLARVLPKLIERVRSRPLLSRALVGHLPIQAALRGALALGEVDRSILPEDLLPYMRHMVNLDLLMFLQMLQSAGEHSAMELLPTLDIPVLVVAGERDSFTPARLAEEMARALPKGEFWLAQGATHVVPIERQAALKERVMEFLERHQLIAGTTPKATP